MTLLLLLVLISYQVLQGLQDTTYRVHCETTKGPLEITVHPSWAPIGAWHFLELVQDEFYTDIGFFRCVKRFLTQFGISADPQKKHWHHQNLQDDPRSVAPCLPLGLCGRQSRRSRLQSGLWTVSQWPAKPTAARVGPWFATQSCDWSNPGGTRLLNRLGWLDPLGWLFELAYPGLAPLPVLGWVNWVLSVQISAPPPSQPYHCVLVCSLF